MNWVLLAIGGVLAGVGYWGWRDVTRLVSPRLSEESRAHQEAVLRRGSGMLLFAGACFIAFALYHLVKGWLA